MASPHHKAERFVTQIYWTYKNGGYETMERLILNLQDKEWSGYDAENPSRGFTGFSIQHIKKEYAEWQGVISTILYSIIFHVAYERLKI